MNKPEAGEKKPKAIAAIEEFLTNAEKIEKSRGEGPYDEHDPLFAWSISLENIVCDEYDEMKAWSTEACKIIADEVPDACERIEPGDEFEPFAEAIRDIYERAMKARKP